MTTRTTKAQPHQRTPTPGRDAEELDLDRRLLALDHLDAVGLCSCWTLPRACPRREASE